MYMLQKAYFDPSRFVRMTGELLKSDLQTPLLKLWCDLTAIIKVPTGPRNL